MITAPARNQSATRALISRRSLVRASLLLFATGASLNACGVDREAEADELMEQKEYQAALEIYEELDYSDETEQKMSECRFWLFVEYIRAQGGLTVQIESNNPDSLRCYTNIAAHTNGTVDVKYHEETFSEESQIASTVEMSFSVPYPSPDAEANGNYSIISWQAKGEQTYKGAFDIGMYKEGDSIEWDEVTDEARSGLLSSSLGIEVLKFNSAYLAEMISALKKTMQQSGTGCTLQDLGFGAV